MDPIVHPVAQPETKFDAPPVSQPEKKFDVALSGLKPILPEDNPRWDRSARVVQSKQTLEPAMHCGLNMPTPKYLGEWRQCVHPDGQAYYHRTSGLSVVTEAPLMTDSNAMQRVADWIEVAQKELAKLQITDTSSIELWLALRCDKAECSYYFVDHSNRAPFWLTKMDTADIGTRWSASLSHLKHTLESNYWKHLENYPSHAQHVSMAALDELISIFMHARADHMTSLSSTFPYNADECAAFLELLKDSRNRPFNSATNTLISRLWSLTATHRFQTHFGEEHARLDRNVPILGLARYRRNFILSGISRVLFNLPEGYRDKFEDLYVDDFVYAHQWTPFVTYHSDEWRQTIQYTFGLLICNLLVFPVSSAPSVTLASILFSLGSILIGLALLHHWPHRDLANATVEQAFEYIEAHRSTKHGYQAIATVYSLPKGFFIWGLILFAIQGLYMAFGFIDPIIAGVSLTIITGVAYAVYRTIHPSSYSSSTSSSPSSFLSFFSRRRDVVETSQV